jgi:hypothetical protein
VVAAVPVLQDLQLQEEQEFRLVDQVAVVLVVRTEQDLEVVAEVEIILIPLIQDMTQVQVDQVL